MYQTVFKRSAVDRMSVLNDLTEFISDQKSEESAILDACGEIKPKMDKLSNIFKTGKISPSDVDTLALDKFVAVLKEKSKQSNEIYDKASKVSEELLSLLYKRFASCSSILENVPENESFEDLLQVDLTEPLTSSNCISILKSAKNRTNQQIYDQALDFLNHNFIGVVNQAGQSFYRRVSCTVFEELLRSDKLKVENEDDVVLVLKNWLHFDIRHRKKFAAQLLKQVRFGHVSKEVLEKFENDSSYLIMLDEETRKLVDDASMGGCSGNARNYTKPDGTLLVFGEDGNNFSYRFKQGLWEEWGGENHGLFLVLLS